MVSNPFATRYTRPHLGEYLFPVGSDAGSLLERLRDDRWWGQITGPHGSGKSTLAHTLLPSLQAAGRCVELYALHTPTARGRDGSRPPAALWRSSVSNWNACTQIVVDGYEQPNWLQRTRLQWHCRRRQAGLLVTAHRDLGLPQLWRTETSAELTQRIVARLLAERDAGWLRQDKVERLFAEHQGNVREVLFALYDSYERLGR